MGEERAAEEKAAEAEELPAASFAPAPEPGPQRPPRLLEIPVGPRRPPEATKAKQKRPNAPPQQPNTSPPLDFRGPAAKLASW